MAAKVEKLEGNKAKLEISISAEEFGSGINKAYQKLRGKFNIPGFRKGKAPRAIIENHYGKEVFYEDAFDEIFPEAYSAAVKENDLDVVARPEKLDITKIDAKDGLEFSVEVQLKPDVKLGQYEKLKVTKTVRKVKPEDIDAEIQKTREQNARWVEVERAAKDGDTVVMDYSGSVDGEKFEGGTAENQTLELGSKRFIPGFEEGLVGLKKGDEKDLDIKFPDEYTPELAGKDAVFAVKVLEVKEKQLPEVDDEFAQDVSEFETLDEYKKDVGEKLQKQYDSRAKVEMEDQVLRAVSENADVDVPDVMVEGQIDNQLQQLRYQLMYQGLKLEDYVEYMGNSMEELREGYRESAAEQTRMRLVMDALIDELKLQPTPEEAEAEMEKMAKEQDKTLEEFKKMMSNDELDYFGDRVAMERLFDYLVEHAVINEVEYTGEKEEKPKEAPAKKSAGTKKATEKKESKDEADAAEKKPAAKKTTAKKTTTKKADDADQAAPDKKEAKPKTKAAPKKKADGEKGKAE